MRLYVNFARAFEKNMNLFVIIIGHGSSYDVQLDIICTRLKTLKFNSKFTASFVHSHKF